MEHAATPDQVMGELRTSTGCEYGVALRLEPEHCAEVILEILTDLRGMVDYLNAVRTQLLAVADSGKHQQLGGIDRSGTQYDYPAGLNEMPSAVLVNFHTHRPTALHNDPGDGGFG